MGKEPIFDCIEYDNETGRFSWKIKIGRKIKQGANAGTLSNKGYVYIRYKGTKYSAHKLAWGIWYGRIPTEELDHINGDRADNRISNLRIVSHRQNMINQKCHRDGRLPGAVPVKNGRKWRARIRSNGHYLSLGYYDTEEESHEVYMRAFSKIENINAPSKAGSHG